MATMRVTVRAEGLCWRCNGTGWVGLTGEDHTDEHESGAGPCIFCDWFYDAWPENVEFRIIDTETGWHHWLDRWYVDGPD